MKRVILTQSICILYVETGLSQGTLSMRHSILHQRSLNTPSSNFISNKTCWMLLHPHQRNQEEHQPRGLKFELILQHDSDGYRDHRVTDSGWQALLPHGGTNKVQCPPLVITPKLHSQVYKFVDANNELLQNSSPSQTALNNIILSSLPPTREQTDHVDFPTTKTTYSSFIKSTLANPQENHTLT